MIALIIAVGIVVVVSALCSLLEAALYAIPIGHIESLAKDGSKAGRVLRQLRIDVGRPITAILSLNTIANTAGAAVAGALAVNVFGQQWLAYFSACFTLVILIFSEIIPKTTGVVYSRTLAVFIAHPLQLLVWVFRPLIWLCHLITGLIARGHAEQSISEEELIAMAYLGLRTGEIKGEKVQVIQNIILLESKTAQDIMTPRTVVFSLNADLTMKEVYHQLDRLTYSRIPVYDKDLEDVVGIAYRSTVLTAIANEQWEVKLEALMQPVHFVTWGTSANRLLQMFLEYRQLMFVVIDEFGGLAGVVTLEDVLEEILGQNIVDESDQVTDLRALARRRRQQILEQYQGGR